MGFRLRFRMACVKKSTLQSQQRVKRFTALVSNGNATEPQASVPVKYITQ